MVLPISALLLSACTQRNELIKSLPTTAQSPARTMGKADEVKKEIGVQAPVTTASNSTKPASTPARQQLLSIPLQCRKHVLTPAVFKSTTKELRTYEGSPAYTNVPATIEWETVRFQTAPARFPHETVPATYREVTEKVTTLRRRIEVVGKAATYKTINKPVTIREAYTDWKPGCAAQQPLKCITRIPAKRQVIQQKFIDIPASVMQVERPEQSIEFKRKILVSPGKGYGKPIPAQYKTVKIGRVSKVWQLIARQQPDQHATIPIQLKVRPERLRASPALCYEQVKPADITLIQQRLQQHGYAASLSGAADQQTLQAIIKFQQDKQLPVGAVTIETLRKLAEDKS